MNLKKLQFNWDKLGAIDPLWAILSFPEKEGNKWTTSDFFATGKQEINDVMHTVENLGITISSKRALDFGCGVGRLTQSLAIYFEEVHGVDIAPSMIQQACEYNLYISKVFYHLNKVDNLSLFPDNYFDFIYSNIVLQHIEPQYSKKYIQDFLRILSPGGVLIFHLPDNFSINSRDIDKEKIAAQREFSNSPKERIRSIIPLQLIDCYRFIRYGNQASKRAKMEMYGVKKDEVVGLIKEWATNIKIIDIIRDNNVDEKWIEWRYFITKE
ncbi:class I SAM-dependent methyltransferase [Calothrix sp. FACHB-156]|nr:class I SAM-dependent methyltransferase [Calothrix sp. FACHB-156]